MQEQGNVGAFYQRNYTYDAETNTFIPAQAGAGAAPAKPISGPKSSPASNVNTPAGQAVLFGQGVGMMALVLTSTGALIWHWPWYVPAATGLGAGVFAAGAFGAWVSLDERALQWAYSPAGKRPPSKAVAKVKEVVRLLKVRSARGIHPQADEIAPVLSLSPAEDDAPNSMEIDRRTYARDLHYFLRTVYTTRDARWEIWSQITLPSGVKCSRERWEEWCQALVEAGLAVKPYSTATIKLTSSYREALEAFGDVLRDAL